MWQRLRDLIYPVCPQCDGAGGSEGYFGGDWTGCFCCNPDEDREEPIVRIWFWQVWRNRYNLWQLDRWVDSQIESDRRRWAAEEAASKLPNGERG